MTLNRKLLLNFILAVVILTGLESTIFAVRMRDMVVSNEKNEVHAVISTLDSTVTTSTSHATLIKDLNTLKKNMPDVIVADVYDITAAKPQDVASTNPKDIGQPAGSDDMQVKNTNAIVTLFHAKSVDVSGPLHAGTGKPYYSLGIQFDMSKQLHSVYIWIFTIVLISLVLSALMVLAGWKALNSMLIKPLQTMSAASSEIAAGNLDVQRSLIAGKKDEMGLLARNFASMTENLKTLVINVAESAHSVARSSAELSTNAEETTRVAEQSAANVQSITRGSQTQLDSVEKSVAIMEDMTATLNRMNQGMKTASESAASASRLAQTGTDAVEEVTLQMGTIEKTVNKLAEDVNQLGDQTEQITGMVQIIEDIATQTSLLSLNAAIEAARAGTQGKGFAVVAAEVRKLADQSAQSAQQIRQLVEAIQKGTRSTSGSMRVSQEEVRTGLKRVIEVGGMFDDILLGVKEVTTKVRELAAAMEEVVHGTKNLRSSLSSVSEVAEGFQSSTNGMSAAYETQLASMEQITASAVDLSSMAEALLELVQKFSWERA